MLACALALYRCMTQRTRAMGMSTVTTTLALLESDQVWSGGVSLRAKWGRFQSKPAWTEHGSTSEVQSIVADYEKEMARGRQIGHDWLISSCWMVMGHGSNAPFTILFGLLFF